MAEELVGRLNYHWEMQLREMLRFYQSPSLNDISSLRVDTKTNEVWIEKN